MEMKFSPMRLLKCMRCGKSVPITFVSIFDSKDICEDCEMEERDHPMLEEAVNYVNNSPNPRECKGIGWPPPEKEY